MSDPGKLSTTMRIEIPPERADSEGNKLQEPRAVQRKSVRPDQSGETDPCATTCDAAFQNFFQNVYDAVVLTNPDGRIVDANRRAERFLQYSRDEAYGYDIMAFISGADGSVMRSIHETLENDRFVLIQAFCRRRDGGLFPAEISVNRCSLSHSPYLCFFIRDISVRKEAEDLLRVGSNAIHNAGTGILISDLNGLIEYLNPAMLDILGQRDEDAVLGASIGTFLPGAGMLTNILDTVKRGEHWVGTFHLVNTVGGMPYVQVSAAANFDEDDELQGMVFSFLDSTEKRRSEERNQQLVNELKHSNEDLERFAYVVSHDLQEPLRKISTFSGMLKRALEVGQREKVAELLERLQKASARMHALIQALRDLSRVATRARPFTRVDLFGIANETVTDMDWAVQQAGASVAIDNLPACSAEPVQMRQLFQNLVGNALKFRKAGVPLHIRIASRRAPDGINGEARFDLVVEDNGIGFEDKYCERIFEVFQRLHGKTEYEGTGIGLAICRKIAERHGGAIRAEGEPGKGARFIINLPYGKETGWDMGDGGHEETHSDSDSRG